MNHHKTERIRAIKIRKIRRAIERGNYPNPEQVGKAAARLMAEIIGICGRGDECSAN